jgi:hypothetical protein
MLGRIGHSAVDLWRAELQTLTGELGDSGRLLVRALVLGAIAAFLAFWALGLLFTAAVAALALALPLWAAAAIMLAVVALAAWLVARSAQSRFRSLESPVRTVKRRVGDHVAWWQQQLLPPEGAARHGAEGGSPGPPRRGRRTEKPPGEAPGGDDDGFGGDDPYLASASREVDPDQAPGEEEPGR